MSGKRTAVLGAVFLVLAAYFLAFEGVSVEPEPPEWEGLDKIVRCPPEGLEALRVSFAGGAEISAERSGGRWRLAGGAELSGYAEGAIDDLARSLCTLPVIETIPASGSLGEFGLESPSAVIRAETAGGSESLRLGGSTPTGTSLYAKREASSDVLRVGALLGAELDKVRRHAVPGAGEGGP